MTAQVIVFGAAGRMGQALLQFHNKVDDVQVIAGVLRPDSELVGEDASRLFGGACLSIPLVSTLSQALIGLSDKIKPVVVEFSKPELTLEVARWCLEQSIPLVSGTTGFTPDQLTTLREMSATIPIVHSNNMSPGVTLCFDLVESLAKSLGETVDVEIYEAHHRHKIDAPSGTALRLGEAVAQGWGVPFEERAVFSRHGRTGVRKSGTIGFAVVRAGDIIGDHSVIFSAEGERIEITHKSTSRMHYAKGGLMAAGWLVTKRPGFYSMADVLAPDNSLT